MYLSKIFILLLAGLSLSGCLESEKSCYERLVADFEGSMSFATQEIRKTPTYMKEDRERIMQYSATASRSKSIIRSIYYDNDMDACDFYSDGNRLVQK